MATTKHERITVPTSLEDITVEQYQKLLELPEEMDDMDRKKKQSCNSASQSMARPTASTPTCPS
jgi:hypothetical protein